MKKLESLDKYVIMPNVGFYGGFVFDGEDIFLCEDHDVDENYDFTVRQEIKNNVLITDLTREYARSNGCWVKEKSHLELDINVGDILVYVEGTGFTIPEYRMCKIDEAIGQYNILKGVDENDINRNEEKNS